MNNILILCVLAMMVGIYTFIKHLNAFNAQKTPAKDAWLLAVGVLGWSLMLHFLIARDDTSLYATITMWFVYWIGDNLKIQQYCKQYYIRYLKRIKRTQ